MCVCRKNVSIVCIRMSERDVSCSVSGVRDVLKQERKRAEGKRRADSASEASTRGHSDTVVCHRLGQRTVRRATKLPLYTEVQSDVCRPENANRVVPEGKPAPE